MLVLLQDCLNQGKNLYCKGSRKRLTWGRKAFSHSFTIVINVYPILKGYNNADLKIHIYLPVKFVYFLKIRLILNIFSYFCMFVNQHFIYIECSYLKN